MSPKDPRVALPDTDDPYVLLEVRPGASADQIRRAYLRRVKVFKPDRYPAEFRRVREAYDRLREQEAWFHAWQQASEVVRQAQERAARRGEGEAGEAADAEPSDEALEAEAARQAEEDAQDEPSIERIMAELESELRQGRSEAGAGEADEGEADEGEADEDAGEVDEDAGEADEDAGEADADEADADEADADEADEDEADEDADEDEADEDGADEDEDESPAPRSASGDAWPPPRRPAPSVVERLDALAEAVHADLLAEHYAEAASRLLDREVLPLASAPEFGTLLLEACCALVWAAPERFDQLVARFGDLVAAQDTEFRDGALLHRRTLTEELAGWREAIAGWPQLERFVMLGASLRPPVEAELGLHLGRRAADDPSGFLDVICRATARAPGIAALYVGMAERWSRCYGTLPSPSEVRVRPTVEQAAVALAGLAQHHRWVRWEQVRPLLMVGLLGAILVLTSSRVVELIVVGLLLALWAWRAWAASPEDRIYVRVLRPSAASWLWATQASPDELAVALQARLPARGTWAAVLHPGDLTTYPHRLGNDLALLSFAVTAPMIPRLGAAAREP
ncbi:MAG: J domain-containing protein [Myxococcales bacterium]|nr:J domain-containing protein [Myxococcales bacterium]